MTIPTFGRPNAAHGPRFAKHYLELTSEFDELLRALEINQELLINNWSKIPEEKGDFAYAEDKWTVKGVISHVIDTERIFAYRALRLSRNDETQMEGFEQDHYDAHSNLSHRTIKGMMQEFRTLREHSLQLFASMNSDQLDFVGTASHNPLSARTAGWIMIGHAIHHENILAERYL
jgi:uncharacterized damage-inducible protein DinB